MGDVINVQFKDEKFIAGGAICLHCGHEWICVNPLGTTELKCPACLFTKGVNKGLVTPEQAWQCSCGCYHFFITNDAAACCYCGKEQRF